MPSLFVLPRVVGLSVTNQLLPGAKLTFTATGTSTLQNTYQDEDLTVPHANPVVANAAGSFAPIYLDPSLPNYRVLLTDSANVTQAGYPIDDYPSNQNQAQTFRLKSTAPSLIFEETDAASNNKKWAIRVNTERLIFSLLNDAESVETEVFNLDRSGTALGEYTFFPAGLGSLVFLPSGAGSIAILDGGSGDLDVLSGPGIGVMRYKDHEVATVTSGTFTGTFTGFPSAVTQQVAYTRIGSPGARSTVILVLQGFSATSNATTMTMTGIPAAIAASEGLTQPILIKDNGTDAAGNVRLVVGASTTLTFGVAAAIGGFTNSGAKGLAGEWIQLVYTTVVP